MVSYHPGQAPREQRKIQGFHRSEARFFEMRFDHSEDQILEWERVFSHDKWG